ncbi:MAG: hypothetical protein B6I20_02175 [Bacteroidetes bacterium 4572_117]|nr:MAG: hypothetical protein B6I20_02175 [Bacteroidetes bacterium 4572_117]
MNPKVLLAQKNKSHEYTTMYSGSKQDTLIVNLSNDILDGGKPNNLVKQINDGYDATSYIYSCSGENIPLSDNFINVKFSHGLKKFSNNKNLHTSVKSKLDETNNGFGIKLIETDYVFIVLLFLSLLIGFVKVSGNQYLNRTVASVFNFSYSHILFNGKIKLFRVNHLILLLIFHISSGILLVTISKYFSITVFSNNVFTMYFSYIAIIFFIVVVYKLIIKFIGLFFHLRKQSLEHLYYVNNILKLLGIINVILLFGIVFTPENFKSTYIGVIFFIYIIAYVLRALKILYDFLQNQFSLFYLILYFCALEIVPLIIMGKIVFLVYEN